MSHENSLHFHEQEEAILGSEAMPWIEMAGGETTQEEWMHSLGKVLTTAQNEKEIVTAIVHTALHLRGLDQHVERLTPLIAEAAMADRAVLSSMLKLGDQVLKQTLQ